MTNKLETAIQFAEGVKSGRVPANKYIKLAVERHFRDLGEAEVRGWYFSDKAAQKALTFFDFLVLTKGVSYSNVPKSQINPDGTIRFLLAPWQAFMIASIFGWKKTGTKKRRFTEAYIEISKKNGKSTIASGISNLMLIADKEPGPEIYFGAYTRDQAGICFEEAVAQIKDSKHLKKRVRILKNSVTIPRARGKMTAVSHDANNTEGKNAHCSIIDEYHVHKSDKVKDSLLSGQVAREQPLQFVITTAGYNKQGPCYKHRNICIEMLEGKYRLDHMFVMVFGLDEKDDWKDESNWVKANPSLGITTKIEKLRNDFAMALRSGSKEVDFKTKHLNMWVDAAVTWIPSETWKQMARPDFMPPKGAISYAGIDLGRSNDIASFALYFPEHKYLTVRHYVAEEAAIYVEKSGISYLDWINDGYLDSTPGKTTDYERIIRDVLATAETYDLKLVAFDPYGAALFKDRLADELGMVYLPIAKDDGTVKYEYVSVMQPFRQGFLSFGPPTRLFEEMCINNAFTHDNNPVTGWMLGNVALATDAA